MEPGVFIDPGIDWIKVGISVAMAWIFLAGSITLVSLHGPRKPVYFDASFGQFILGVALLLLIVSSFITTWVLLGVGLDTDKAEGGCINPEYASQGIYEVERSAIFSIGGKGAPLYYELDLRAGLRGNTEGADAIFIRCIKVKNNDVFTRPSSLESDFKYAIKHPSGLWELARERPGPESSSPGNE